MEARRRSFDSLHNTIAGSLALCEEAQALQSSRAELVESSRSALLNAIQGAREQMVAAILAKEKALSEEVNRVMDLAKLDAEEKARTAERLAISLGRQLDVMSFSIGAGAEGELLPYLPGLEAHARADTSLVTGRLHEAPQSDVLFQLDEVLEKAVETSPLGFLKLTQDELGEMQNGISGRAPEGGEGRRLGLTLTLVTSFHGGARDDISEPLLTDLVLLTNGDVILTDRDNRCVKKFNQSGKLLTRVMLDASPCRVAVVSHGRAVISTTSRRELYFLSLHGTVRVLSSVRVKKLYTFLTSLGGGMLAAGTNYGDCLDLITEDGRYVRTIYSSKPERAGISRPFYVTPVRPLFHQGIQQNSPNVSPASSDVTETGKKNGEVSNASSDTIPVGSANSKNKTETGSYIEKGGKRRSNDKNSGSSNIRNSISSNNSNNSTRKASVTNISTTNKPKVSPNGKGKSSPTSTSASSSSSLLPSPTASSPIDPSANITSKTDSLSSDDLWVTDSARKILFRLRQQDGKTTFTLKTRSDLQLTLECPLGVTVHPSGLPLLVDRDTDSVLLLDSGGNYIRPVLTAADGLSRPCAIYAGHRGHVALSQVDGMVKIYSSKLQYF